jgi:hypothetical protein
VASVASLAATALSAASHFDGVYPEQRRRAQHRRRQSLRNAG